MSMPINPLLATLAQRVQANLDFIEKHAPRWELGSKKSDDPPYSDTQLLISLLGILVFPHERTPDALGELLDGYDADFDDVIAIKYSSEVNGKVVISGIDGVNEPIDPRSIASLPRLLRNSIAHFNMRPIDVGGRFGGIRIWNVRNGGEITFVADLFFDGFRPLAEHILRALAGDREGLNLNDPQDPLEQLTKQGKF